MIDIINRKGNIFVENILFQNFRVLFCFVKHTKQSQTLKNRIYKF